jgi:hypothetical protein
MSEENNVVVAGGTVRVHKNEGTIVIVQFCDVFEQETGKIERLNSFTADIKNSS